MTAAKKSMADYKSIGNRRKQEMERLTSKQTEATEQQTPPKTVEAPAAQRVPDSAKPGAQRGLPDGWTRFTVTIPIEMAEELKDLAYTERLKLKDVVVAAFENVLRDKRNELMYRPDSKRSRSAENN